MWVSSGVALWLKTYDYRILGKIREISRLDRIDQIFSIPSKNSWNGETELFP